MLFLLGNIEEDAINNVDDVLQAIVIGLVVATFLLNSGRALKAIEVSKECLIFLNNKVLKPEGEIFNLLHIRIYNTIFWAHCIIPDHKKALIYGRKLLNIYRECGKKDEEKNVTLKLADKYRQQYKYLEARELYEKAIDVTKELGERKNEAYSNGRVGIISYYLGDFDRAKEYLEKAVAITLQIGDKKGEASSYVQQLRSCIKISW